MVPNETKEEEEEVEKKPKKISQFQTCFFLPLNFQIDMGIPDDWKFFEKHFVISCIGNLSE